MREAITLFQRQQFVERIKSTPQQKTVKFTVCPTRIARGARLAKSAMSRYCAPLQGYFSGIKS